MIRFAAWFWALPLYPCLKVDRCFVALTSPGSWTWSHTASKRHCLDEGGGWRIAGLRAWGENPMRWRIGAPRICFINQPQVSIPVSGLKGLTWIAPRSSKGVYGMDVYGTSSAFSRYKVAMTPSRTWRSLKLPWGERTWSSPGLSWMLWETLECDIYPVGKQRQHMH